MKKLKAFEEYNGDKIKDFANAFSKFLNSFNSTLKSYIHKDKYKDDYTIMEYNRSLISISYSNYALIRVITLYDLNRFFSKKEIQDISEFIGIEPDKSDIYIKVSDLDKYIGGLTMENYKRFFINKNAKKYNI